MQERLSVGNVKLLHAGGGLPHVHYFPTKENEQQYLVKDENDHAKKSYMRSVVCSKTSLIVLLLLLVALTSYFLLLPIRGQEDDDNNEEISITERLLINHGDSIKYQSIAHNFKLQEMIPAIAIPTEEELSESVTNVVNEKQGDDSINDSISQDYGRVPTEDEAEQVANEIHLATHRLEALLNEWTKESNSNSNSSEGETAMAFLVFLIQAIKEARGSITTQKDELIPEQVFFPDLEEVNHSIETNESFEMEDDAYPAYNDDYDDDSKQDNIDQIFS